MPDALVKPPEPCPAAYEAHVSKIHEGLAKLYTSCSIPHFIQSTLAKAGFCTTGDLKWCWGSPSESIAKGPAELGFTDTKNDYDADTSLHTSIRLGQLVELAAKAHNREIEYTVTPEMNDFTATLMPGKRQELEDAYLSCYKETAEIVHQGSDHLTAVMNRSISKGTVPFVDLNHMVPFMPDLDSIAVSAKKYTCWGKEYMK